MLMLMTMRRFELNFLCEFRPVQLNIPDLLDKKVGLVPGRVEEALGTDGRAGHRASRIFCSAASSTPGRPGASGGV